jgi:hypothetical protein
MRSELLGASFFLSRILLNPIANLKTAKNPRVPDKSLPFSTLFGTARAKSHDFSRSNSMIKGTDAQSNSVIDHLKNQIQRGVAVLTWSFLGFLYICLISQWLTISSRDKLFRQYIDDSIQVAAKEHHPAKELRAQLLIKAADLSLPVQADEVDVSSVGKTVRAIVRYKADISMPIVNKPIYQMSLRHDITAFF